MPKKQKNKKTKQKQKKKKQKRKKQCHETDKAAQIFKKQRQREKQRKQNVNTLLRLLAVQGAETDRQLDRPPVFVVAAAT